MDDNHHAVLADFGLMSVLLTDLVATMATTGVGTARWMAPELLAPELYRLPHSIPSKKSDIYAYGMAIYEVCGFFSQHCFIFNDM